MKKDKKKTKAKEPVKKKKMMITIKIEQEIELVNLLYQAIDKYDAKPIIKQLAANYYMNSAMVESPISGFLMSKEKVDKIIENAEAAWVLMYAVNHWDELKEKGKKYLQELKEKRAKEDKR